MSYLTEKKSKIFMDLGLMKFNYNHEGEPADWFKGNGVSFEKNSRTAFQRDMTDWEKEELRRIYIEELEVKQPALLEMIGNAEVEYNRAKANLASLRKQVEASQEVLAHTGLEIKAGRVEENLEAKFIFRFPFKKYWVYLFYSQELMQFECVDIQEMETREADKWYNEHEVNAQDDEATEPTEEETPADDIELVDAEEIEEEEAPKRIRKHNAPLMLS